MKKSLTGSSVVALFLMCAAVGAGLYSWVQSPETLEQATAHSSESSIFGIRQKDQTQVFAAADVPAKVTQAVKDTLAAGVDTWGSSGRLEYWVLGTERDAAIRLSELFCERRVAAGQMTRQACLADCSNQDHGFLMYQEIGAQALKTGRPRGSAGHNGGAEWGFHRMASSLPLGFAGLLNIAGEEEQITILHEYWHSVQHSFLQTTDHRRRRKQMGPVWFVEGAAVAMAELTAAKLWADGKLPRWNNASFPWQSLEKRMVGKMESIQELRKVCPSLLPDTYDGQSGELAYASGAWAIAWLMRQHGQDVLLRSFHPNVEKLGWEGAFQHSFGQSSAAFAREFEQFVDLPLTEQVGILPVIKQKAVHSR